MLNPIVFAGVGAGIFAYLFLGFRPIDIVGVLPKNPFNSYPSRPLSQIQTIVVHHAAVDYNLPGATPEGYARFHIDAYNWPGIGYHIVIQPDGKVYLTNYLSTVSNHTGTLNPTSVGICLSGNFDVQQPTAAQMAGLRKAIAWVQRKVSRPLEVDGHFQYSSKTCPGVNVRNKMNF